MLVIVNIVHVGHDVDAACSYRCTVLSDPPPSSPGKPKRSFITDVFRQYPRVSLNGHHPMIDGWLKCVTHFVEPLQHGIYMLSAYV